jgi:hypothetical protein
MINPTSKFTVYWITATTDSRVAVADTLEAAQTWVAEQKNAAEFHIMEYIGGNPNFARSYKRA